MTRPVTGIELACVKAAALLSEGPQWTPQQRANAKLVLRLVDTIEECKARIAARAATIAELRRKLGPCGVREHVETCPYNSKSAAYGNAFAECNCMEPLCGAERPCRHDLERQ